MTFIRVQAPGDDLVTFIKANRIISVEGDNDGSTIVLETKNGNVDVELPFHPDRIMTAIGKASGGPFFFNESFHNVTEFDEPETSEPLAFDPEQ